MGFSKTVNQYLVKFQKNEYTFLSIYIMISFLENSV